MLRLFSPPPDRQSPTAANGDGGWRELDLSTPATRAQATYLAESIMLEVGMPGLEYHPEWSIGEGPACDVIALSFQQDELRGFALLRRRRRPLRFQLGDIVYYRQALDRLELGRGPLIASNGDRTRHTRVLNSFLGHLARISRGSEVLSFEGLPVDGEFSTMLATDARLGRDFIAYVPEQPYAHQYIELPSSYAEYLRTLGKSSRTTFQYRQRRLRREFPNAVSLRCFDEPALVGAFLDDALPLSEKTYQWRLLGLGLRDRGTLERRLTFAADRGWLRAYILYCEGQAVAYLLGYQYLRCFFYFDVGHDPDWQRWSVGSVLQLEVIEELYRRCDPPARFDFSTGYGEHKARFANLEQWEQNVILLPRSIRAHIITSAHRASCRISSAGTHILERLDAKKTIKRMLRQHTGA